MLPQGEYKYLADKKITGADRFREIIAQLEGQRKSRILSLVQCGEDEDNQSICPHTLRKFYERRHR